MFCSLRAKDKTESKCAKIKSCWLLTQILLITCWSNSVRMQVIIYVLFLNKCLVRLMNWNKYSTCINGAVSSLPLCWGNSWKTYSCVNWHVVSYITLLCADVLLTLSVFAHQRPGFDRLPSFLRSGGGRCPLDPRTEDDSQKQRPCVCGA